MSRPFFKNPSVSVFLNLLLMVAVVLPVSAQDNSTFQDLGLYGGQVNTIAVNPADSDIVFAGTYLGDGLFKSEDAGQSWTAVPGFRNLSVEDIAFDPNDSEVVWVANGHFVDVSRDSGDTWETFYFAYDENRFCCAVAVDPFDDSGNTVYVGTGGAHDDGDYGEIFYTLDGGIRWRRLGWLNWFFSGGGKPWSDFNALSFNPNVEGELWAANTSAAGLLFRASNYGWSGWRSFAGAVSDNGPRAFGELRDIKVSPDNASLVFAAGDNGIFRKTTDAEGSGWRATEIDTSCRALAIPVSSPDTVYGALSGAVTKSIDAGKTWAETEIEVADQNGVPALFLALAGDASDPQVLYGGEVDWGVYKSLDGALTWHAANQGILANLVYDTGVDSNGKIVSACTSGVYLQTDNSTWRRKNPYAAYAVRFHPAADDTLFAGQERDLAKSSDRGATWQYLDICAGDLQCVVKSVSIIPGDNDTLIAGTRLRSGAGGEIVKITDAGGDFSEQSFSVLQEMNVPVNTVAVSPADSRLMLAGTGYFYAPEAAGGIFRSSDGGSTWTEVLSGVIVNSISISAANPDIVYAACGGSSTDYSGTACAGIYRSIDAGLTWTKTVTGLPDYYAVADIKADDAFENTVYAALFKGFNDCLDDACVGLNGVYISFNGGAYWTQIGLSDYFVYDVNSFASAPVALRGRSLSYPPATVVAGTESGAYASSMTTGRGTIIGFVIDADNRTGIVDAVVSTDTGSKCRTIEEGFFTLFVASGKHRVSAYAPGYASNGASDVTVVTGGVTDLGTIALTAGGTDPNGSTCFLEDLLGVRHSGLDLFRQFRNEVLNRTPFGRRLSAAYYRLGKAAFDRVDRDPELKSACLALIADAAQIISGFYTEGIIRIPDRVLDRADTFLHALEVRMPATAAAELSVLRRTLRNRDRIKRLDPEHSRPGGMTEPFGHRRKKTN